MASILKAMQEYLEACPAIDLVHLDTVAENPSDYAVTLAGNSKVSEDLAGNKTYRYNFVFYAREDTGNDIDRTVNHDFLQGFADWLEEQDEAGNYPALPANCIAEEVAVSNILLFAVDDNGSAGIYQVQLQLIYTKRSD